MTIAIPSWEGRVSPVLDVAGRLLIVHFEHGAETSRQELLLDQSPPSQLAQRIREAGSDVLVCGAVSRELVNCLTEARVQVVPHVCGEINAVLSAFLKDKLSQPQFKMPGCCKRRRGCNHRRGSVYGNRLWNTCP